MSPLNLLRLLITLQAIGATAVFVLLSTYNPKQRQRYQEAHEAFGKKDASLFELPAFRAEGSQCPNPFENTTWLLTGYEKVKISILAVTLFPFRLVGVLCSFLGAFLVASLFLRMGSQPMARLATAAGCRLVLFFLGFFWIRVRGQQAQGAGVLVSNHCTFLDGVLWIAIAAPRVFADESNFKGTLMQVFAKALKIVCFDRSSRDSRRMAREIMASAAAEAVAGKAPPILVFPEGTTKNTKTLITFKDGAFAPGLPVQPAVLRYAFRHCDPTWVFAGPGLPMIAFRLLCQFVNWVEVEFLPVCNPSEEDKQDPQKFAQKVQSQLASVMKVPVTEHAVEDFQFQLAAIKTHLPAEAGLVGFSALRDVFSVNAGQIKEQMLVFKEMDRNGDGRVTFDQFKDCFASAFHAPSDGQTELLHKFFYQLTGGQPTLDFRRFLIGLALVNEAKGSTPVSDSGSCTATSPPQFEEFVDKYKGRMYVQLVFAAFAAGSDSCITWREFDELWSWLYPAGVASGASTAGKASERRPEERRPSVAEEVSSSARKVFEEIGGEGAEELTFEKFTAYAECNPVFEKQLRQAFFGRISSVLAPG